MLNRVWVGEIRGCKQRWQVSKNCKNNERSERRQWDCYTNNTYNNGIFQSLVFLILDLNTGCRLSKPPAAVSHRWVTVVVVGYTCMKQNKLHLLTTYSQEKQPHRGAYACVQVNCTHDKQIDVFACAKCSHLLNLRHPNAKEIHVFPSQNIWVVIVTFRRKDGVITRMHRTIKNPSLRAIVTQRPHE